MKRWLMTWLLLAAAFTVRAQDGQRMSVEECVAKGLKVHARIASSAEQLQAAEAREREYRSRLFPAFSGRASYLRLSSNIPDFNFELPPDLFPGLNTEGFSFPALLNRYEASVSVEQPIFAGRRLANNLKSAGYRADAARQQLARGRNELAYRIRAAYWTLYEQERTIRVVETARQQVEEQLHVIREMRKRGVALESDVLSVKTRLSEVELQRLEAEQALALARLNLNYWTGLEPDEEVVTASEPAVSSKEWDGTVVTERAFSRRPELQAAGYERKAAEAELRSVTGGYWPRLSAMGRYLYARPNAYFVPQEDRFDWTWEVGLVLSMDLWSWGGNRQRVAAARAEANRVRYLQEDLRSQVRIEVRRALQQVERSADVVRIAQDGLEQAQAVYGIMKERYRQGMALTSELLESESAYRKAELQLIRARAGAEKAEAALWFASGIIQPDREES